MLKVDLYFFNLYFINFNVFHIPVYTSKSNVNATKYGCLTIKKDQFKSRE